MPPCDRETALWFTKHILPHEAMLRAWLQSRFGGQVDVDDIVQEAYVRLCQARAGGESQAPKAFLFATARNLYRDYAAPAVVVAAQIGARVSRWA